MPSDRSIEDLRYAVREASYGAWVASESLLEKLGDPGDRWTPRASGGRSDVHLESVGGSRRTDLCQRHPEGAETSHQHNVEPRAQTGTTWIHRPQTNTAPRHKAGRAGAHPNSATSLNEPQGSTKMKPTNFNTDASSGFMITRPSKQAALIATRRAAGEVVISRPFESYGPGPRKQFITFSLKESPMSYHVVEFAQESKILEEAAGRTEIRLLVTEEGLPAS